MSQGHKQFSRADFSAVKNPPRTVYIGQPPKDVQSSKQFLASLDSELGEFFGKSGAAKSRLGGGSSGSASASASTTALSSRRPSGASTSSSTSSSNNSTDIHMETLDSKRLYAKLDDPLIVSLKNAGVPGAAIGEGIRLGATYSATGMQRKEKLQYRVSSYFNFLDFLFF